jgi:membrane associated rhomboid family serine protease/Zn-finger nucleic acid-binding protein
MFVCPNCNQVLTRFKTDLGVLWGCDKCQGRAVSVNLLRRTVSRDYVNTLWQHARNLPAGPGKACPTCSKATVEVATDGITQPLMVDVCKRCHFVWLDVGESGELPLLPPKPKNEPELSQEARELLALHKVEQLAREARQQDGSPPAEWWQVIATLCGLPIEEDAAPARRLPWITWSVGFLMVLATALAFQNLTAVIQEWGMIPANPLRHNGLTFLTSFFLHGGVLHLLGNLYFLIIFGDNVEDFLGKTKYALLLFGATLLGDVCHVLLDPQSQIPTIGASGGISGIIAFYALKFPHVRLTFAFRYWFYVRWFSISAAWAFVLWTLLQFLGIWQQISGFSNVSAAAHLGGAVAGLACFIIWRRR